MKILALETTGKYGSAAVIGDNGAACSMYSENEMNHLQDIISISDAAIKAAGITKKDITHVAASIGPGSFTGIRIGVTTARTLGQMLEIPCVAVSSLEGMMNRVQNEAAACGCTMILACINARRHQTYAGLWECKENFISMALEEKQYMIEDVLEAIKNRVGKVYITGDGIDAYGEIIEEMLDKDQYVLAPEEIRYQSAENIANIALNKVNNGEFIEFSELLPNYMRLSEAEQRLKEGKLSEKIKNLK